MTTSRRALGCSDARRAGRTAGRSLSVGTFPTLRPFGHQQPREDAASVRRGAVTSDRSVRPPPLAACWQVPLPTRHDSASRRRWWPHGFARMRPGLSHQPPHRCRHGSGARENGHRPYHDPRPRRNGAATTGTPTCSLVASLPCTREGPPATATPPFGRGVVTRGGGDGVAGSNTRTPPWWWLTARARPMEGGPYECITRLDSITDADHYVKLAPDTREAMLRA